VSDVGSYSGEGVFVHSIRWGVLVAALCAVAALAVALPAAAAPAAKPSATVAKRLLTKHYVDNTSYKDRRITLAWKAVQFGAPRLGTYLSDGVPPNSKTTVYPARSRFVMTTRHTRDNWKTVFWKTVQLYTAEYVFFKNEFGSWTFRVKNQQIKTISNVIKT